MEKGNLIDIFIKYHKKSLPFLFISTNETALSRYEIGKIYNPSQNTNGMALNGCKTCNIYDIDEHAYDNSISLIESRVLGLFGNRGIINDFDYQEIFFQCYDKKLLTFLSNIILNRLAFYQYQWICSCNKFYYFQLPKFYKGLQYWQYNNPIKSCDFSYKWKKIPCKFPLKVGQRFTDGIIGNYTWVYESSMKNQNVQKKKPLFLTKINYKINNYG